jgi:hypothetical protein
MGKTWIKLFEGAAAAMILWAAAMGTGPRISQARQEQRLPLMVERLHEVRTAIAHFKADHGGLLPGQRQAGETITAEAFAAALRGLRNDGGGPYLRQIPANPFIADKERCTAVAIVQETGETRGQTAWRFCPATGRFTAGDSEFHASY